MALPSGTTGSLSPTFVPARPIGLAVKHPYTFTLEARLPTGLRVPLDSSVLRLLLALLRARSQSFLPASACRHAARTVSSSNGFLRSDVRRTVSEDTEIT